MNIHKSILPTLLVLGGITSSLVLAADNTAPVGAVSGTNFTAVTNVPLVFTASATDDGLPRKIISPLVLTKVGPRVEIAPGVFTTGQAILNISTSSNQSFIPVTATTNLTATFKYPGRYVLSITYTDTDLPAVPLLVTVIVTDPAPAPFKAKIDFTKAGATPVASWIADSGAVYGAQASGLTFGWNADLSAEAFNRPASPNYQLNADPVFNNFIRMQQSVANATWEIAVPNATYDVRLVLGDPANYNGNFAVNVEGAPTVSFKPMAPNHWQDVVVSTQVTDGRLTIAPAPGSVNAKICAVEIQQVASSTN